MQPADEVVAVMVAMQVEGQKVLFALLGADGSVNRMGSGLADVSDREMFIGELNPEVFQQLRAKISPGLNQFLGQSLAASNPAGTVCELTVAFKYANGREAATAWRYGSESQGPPPEVTDFVKETLVAVEPWFRQQKALAAGRSRNG
jgi:hypothetical protein